MTRFFLLTLPAVLVGIGEASAQKPVTYGVSNTVEVKLERVSAPLSSLPERIPTEAQLRGPRPEKDNPSLERPKVPVRKGALPAGNDPALQRTEAESGITAALSSTTAAILSNWTGLTAAVQPSDNTLAVGRNHVVQMTNNSTSTYMRVWNKSGTILVNSKLASGITGIADYGDPNLLYDEQADRYLFVLLYSKSAKKLVVAVSTTPDPTGTWYTYSFTTPNGFPDYPKIGVWGNSYFITTNSSQPSIYALNRSALLSGQPIGNAQVFALSKFNLSFQSASPISQAGPTTPPSNAPASVIRVVDDSWGTTIGADRLELYKLSINWSNTAASSITGPINLYTIPYNSNLCGYSSSACIPQPGSAAKLLDPLSDILMDKVQYRNFGTYESVMCSHVCNVDGNGRAGIRWYELRKYGGSEWSIYQQSTWSPDNTHRWMSSIAMNQNGQVGLGYNVASTSIFPGIRVTGRDSCDAINSMTVAETVAQNGLAANGTSRYGDYNGMVVDPVDNSFWFTANYNPTANWATNVVHFSLSSCPAVAKAKNGAAPHANRVSVKIYPNPVENLLHVQVENTTEKAVLAIYDLTGRKIREQMLNGSSSAISMSGITKGVYLIQVLHNGQVVFNDRLIKE